MFRLLVALACLTSILAVPLEPKENQLTTEIKIVDDITAFQKENPQLEITPLERNANAKGVIRYTLGNRVNGDRLVAQGGDSAQWSAPQNVQLVLRYPQSGTGAVVSYVQILVDQSSSVGQGYVAGGGIGQRTITIVIEARSTTHFAYAAAIYGI